MTKARDSQRARLYRAERMLPEFREKDLGSSPSVETMQAFVDKVTGSAWFRKTYNRTRRIVAEPSYGKRGASAWGPGRIRVSTYYRNRMIILHEIAHCLTWDTPDGAHGRTFCRVYLALVRHYMGIEVACRLREAFLMGNVKYRRKAVVPL